MKFRLFFAVLFAQVLSMKALAYDAKIDGIYYNFLGEQAEVTFKKYSDSNYFSDYSAEITIPASVTYNDKTYVVTSIGKSAFQNCSGLREMYCYAEQVPATGDYTLSGISLNEATLYVPANAIEDYKSAILWSDFGTILPITSDTPVAVQNVEASGVKSLHDAYSLDGRRLTAPKRGLNILRMSNGSTKKVVVK